MEIQILIFFLWIASSRAGWTCDDLLEDTLCDLAVVEDYVEVLRCEDVLLGLSETWPSPIRLWSASGYDQWRPRVASQLYAATKTGGLFWS